MKLSKYLLTLAFGATVFGAVACSNGSDILVPSEDSDGLASLDDEKKDSFSWNDLPVFDTKADLPSCDKFDGVVAQVIDEKAFFTCIDGKWEQIGVTASAYEQLPECTAPLNDFCIDVIDGDEIQKSYVCDEGTWVKGVNGNCLKGDDNTNDVQQPCHRGVDGSCLKGDDNGFMDILRHVPPGLVDVVRGPIIYIIGDDGKDTVIVGGFIPSDTVIIPSDTIIVGGFIPSRGITGDDGNDTIIVGVPSRGITGDDGKDTIVVRGSIPSTYIPGEW